jgi:Tfp pilus assembly protein FimT
MVPPRSESHVRAMLRRTGQTLVELLYVLLILGVLGRIATRSLTRTRDELAVRVVATRLSAELSHTRMLAVLHGGAELVIDAQGSRLRVVSRDRQPLVDWFDLGKAQGVRVLVRAGRDPLVLRYDGRGLGQLANASLELQRGAARGGVVVSSYGRARQW